MKTTSIYDQLEARCRPLIEAFESDLTVHDRQMIADNPGVPFLHWTRSTGTHMVMLQPANTYPPAGKIVPYLFGTADRDHILSGISCFARHCADPRNGKTDLALHFDGRKLTEVSLEKSVDLAVNYTCGIRAEWKAAMNARTVREAAFA